MLPFNGSTLFGMMAATALGVAGAPEFAAAARVRVDPAWRRRWCRGCAPLPRIPR